MKRKILFIANAVRWFDKVNGNTYHSVKIIRVSDNAELKSLPIIYGYGRQYEQSALSLMIQNGWIDKKYEGNEFNYEKENNYPIHWNIFDGLKRDMKNNVA